MQQINYTGLRSSAKQGKWTWWGILIVIAFIVFLPVGVLILMALASEHFWLVAIGSVVIPWGLIYYFGGKQRQSFDKKLSAFAAANGWQTGGDSPVPPVFKKLKYESEPSMVCGSLDGQKFWLYQSDPSGVWRSGEQANSEPVILLSVQLPETMPTLLVVPIKGVLGMAFDEVARTSFDLYPITLEGNFSKNVRTYIEKDAQIPSLSYVTPDVMEVIQQKVGGIVLLSGNYLSISVTDLTDMEGVRALFNDMQAVLKEFKEKMHIS